MNRIKKIRWTEEEVEYLREKYKIMFYLDIAEHLGRSHKSVKMKAKRLVLKCGNRRRKINQKQENNGNWKGGISKDNYRYKKKQVKRYPEKIIAMRAVHNALKSGKINKPNKCEKCGAKKDKKEIHGHHEDYNKPLEVIWLCRKCHMKIHSTEKQK